MSYRNRMTVIGVTVALSAGGATLCCFPVSPPSPGPLDPVDPGPWGMGGLPDPWGPTGGVAGGGGSSGATSSIAPAPTVKFPECRLDDGVTVNTMRAANIGVNRQFAEPTRPRPIKQGLLEAPLVVTGPSVRHKSNDWDATDQGNTSMCVCHDTVQVSATQPYDRHATLGDATACYAAATRIDRGCAFNAIDCPGAYPPVDEGTYGWAGLQAGIEFGWFGGTRPVVQTIQGWHDALLLGPCLFDQNWYDGGYSTDECGQVKPTGKLLGGHSTACMMFDVERQRMWCRNSWGNGFGVERGYFYYTVDSLKLLYATGATMYCPKLPE